MKVVIIEDEMFAARRLENMIREYDPKIKIAAKLESVKESIVWFKSNAEPDLIFLDIHLEDDLSFAIFKEVPISCAIVFTTATDELATRAFHLKGIDFLLKPIGQADLNQTITKYKNWKSEKNVIIDPNELRAPISQKQPQYRERFSVSVGEKLKSINVEDIAYFFSTSGITFAVMNTKNQYSIDLSLDMLKEQLDPREFFRINRQYLVKLKAIAIVSICSFQAFRCYS